MKLTNKFNVLGLCLYVFLLFFSLSVGLSANSKTPDILAPYLLKNKSVKGEIGVVVPPQEINTYLAKVHTAAKEDPAWYREYSKASKPGVPLPWHEKLGLSKEEYQQYLELWDRRKFTVQQQVVVRLEEPEKDSWMIRVSGRGMMISMLRYDPKTNTIKSPNGILKPMEKDVVAEERTALGAWRGKEWRYELKTDFTLSLENFAIGKLTDGKYCLLVYRFQEMARVTGHLLADNTLVIRFSPLK